MNGSFGTQLAATLASVTPRMAQIWDEQGVLCPNRGARGIRAYSADQVLMLMVLAELHSRGLRGNDLRLMARLWHPEAVVADYLVFDGARLYCCSQPETVLRIGSEIESFWLVTMEDKRLRLRIAGYRLRS